MTTPGGGGHESTWTMLAPLGIPIVAETSGLFRQVREDGTRAGQEFAQHLNEGIMQGLERSELPRMFDPVINAISGKQALLIGTVAAAVEAGLNLVVHGIEKIVETVEHGVEEVIHEAVHIGETFEDINRQLITYSTASGQALTDLRELTRDVYSRLDTDTKTLGQTIAVLRQQFPDLATDTKVANDALGDLARDILEVGDRMGAIPTRDFIAAMHQFGLTGMDASKMLAILTGDAQAFGIRIQDLITDMTIAGPTFAELGSNFEATAQGMSKIEQLGLNAQRTILGVATAAKDAGKEASGSDFKQFIQDTIDAIQFYEEHGRRGEAFELGVTVFGARNAAQAIAAGHDIIDMLNGVVDAGDRIRTPEGLHQWEDATRNLHNAWLEFVHDMQAAVGPIAEELVERFTHVLDGIKRWFDEHHQEIMDRIRGWGDAFIQALPAIKQFAEDSVRVLGLFLNFLKAGLADTVNLVGELLEGFGKLFHQPEMFNLGKQLIEDAASINKIDFTQLGNNIADAIKRGIHIDPNKLDDEWTQAWQKATGGDPHDGIPVPVVPKVQPPEFPDWLTPFGVPPGQMPSGPQPPGTPVYPGGPIGPWPGTTGQGPYWQSGPGVQQPIPGQQPPWITGPHTAPGDFHTAAATYIEQRGQQLGLTPTEVGMALAVATHETNWQEPGFMGFGPEAKAAGYNFDTNPMGAIDQYLRQYVSRMPAGLNRNDPVAIASYIHHTVHGAADPRYEQGLLSAYQGPVSLSGFTMPAAFTSGFQPYGLARGTDIRQGQGGFPPWVYQLGAEFGLTASTYPGHQETSGYNRGIDWWPAGVSPDMSGHSYTPEQVGRLQAFAQYLQSVPGIGAGNTGPVGGVTGMEIFENPITGQTFGAAGGQIVGPGTSQPGYYAADFPGHTGHVHLTAPFSIPVPAMGPGNVRLTGYGTPVPGIPGMPGPGQPSTITVPGFDQPIPIGPGESPSQAITRAKDIQDAQDRADAADRKVNDLRGKHDDLQKQFDILDQQKRTAAPTDPEWQPPDGTKYKKWSEANDKLTRNTEALNDALQTQRDAHQSVTIQLQRQGEEMTKAPRRTGTMGGDPAEQLGRGLLGGILEEIGIPDVLGKSPLEWGSVKMGMGALNWGFGVMNAFGLNPLAPNYRGAQGPGIAAGIPATGPQEVSPFGPGRGNAPGPISATIGPRLSPMPGQQIQPGLVMQSGGEVPAILHSGEYVVPEWMASVLAPGLEDMRLSGHFQQGGVVSAIPLSPGRPVSASPNISMGQWFANQSVNNLMSGLGGIASAAMSDLDPRSTYGILHQPVTNDYSITITGNTIADPTALQRALQESQNQRFYTVTGGLPYPSVGSP